jgi:hypothetical protein
MTRRDFLHRLLGATALTAAGLVVPSRTTYVFLTDNPLAKPTPESFEAIATVNRALGQIVRWDVYSGGKIIATREGPYMPTLNFWDGPIA